MCKMLSSRVFPFVCFFILISVTEIDAQYLNVSEIRLVGGSGPYDGRVELNINGIWGTVCDDNFDIYDARVMCRMMNLKAFSFVKGGYYGPGSGPIFAQRFSCGGYETSLQSCTFVVNAQCTHSRDVGITCSECGEISTVNGVANISSDGKVLTITCNAGYTINNTQSHCNGSAWSSPSLACVVLQTLHIDGIRLVDGIGVADGRVEVSVNGEWGTVCILSFDGRAANVMCKMLGFQSYYRSYTYAFYHTGVGNGSILISELWCSGSENHIGECSYKTNHTCSHSQDTALSCYPSTSLSVSGVRLANGTGPYDGRAELLSDGLWGTICDKSEPYLPHGVSFANTICKMMNFSLTHIFEETVYGEGVFPILIQNLRCGDGVVNITSCSYDTAYGIAGYCSHKNDLSLICTPCGLPPNVIESTITFNGSELTASCYPGFAPAQIKMRCLGSGIWDVTCASVYEFPLNVSSIRLQDDYSYNWSSEGLVRILVSGQWGGICKHNFDSNDAAVLCRMMKLTYVSFSSNNIQNVLYVYGVDKTPTYFDNLACTGNESHINECTYDLNNTCSYWDQVAIKCTGYQLNITDIRLSGSSSPYAGRIEVKVNGTWGTICANYFDLTETYVVCNMLGFGYYYQYTLSVFYGYGVGSGPIYLDKLDCDSSSYSHINNCRYVVDSYVQCTHSQDVAVICYGPKLNITDVRLVNGTGPYDGRAEIRVGEVWGTICDQYFDIRAADIFCQEMKLRAIKYYTGAAHGAGSGPIYMDRIICNTYYGKLADCNYLFLNTCTHDRDVSVVCSGPKLNITDVRLVNGTGPYDGRAEIRVGEVWGTICDQNFNILAADLFCQEKKLRAIKFYTGAANGAGSGPIYMDQVICNNYNAKLADCNYLFLNTCTHDRDVSVVCSACGNPDLSNWDVDYFKYNGSELYADCSYYKTYVGILRMKCNNVTGKWNIEGHCKEYSFPLNVTGIRLADGGNASRGRVELRTLDTWGTVCDHSFGMKEADTICRMIGYPPAKAFLAGAYFGAGAGPIFVDELKCGDTAAHINNCTYNTRDNCQHSNDVSVICTDCGRPVSANANFNNTNTSVGAVVKVTCKDGYRMNGNDVVVCQNNGTWTSLTTCTLIDCGDPTPENGIRNTNSTLNGTVVKISCKPGYDLIGNSDVRCQSNDTWTSYPICRIKDCGKPNPTYGNITLSTNTTTYGAQAVISCIKGYRPEGSKIVYCQQNGTWETWQNCTLVDCGTPKPNRGITNNTITTYGSVVGVSCEPGYNLSGAAAIVCEADGTWSGSPICDTSANMAV